MKRYISLLLIFVLTFSIEFYGQSSKAIEKQYNNFDYIDVIKTYKRLGKKGKRSPDVLQKVGDSYYFNSDFDQAVVVYRELIERYSDISPDYYYRYAQCLKATGDSDAASEVLKDFSTKFKNDSRGKRYIESPNYLSKIEKNSDRYDIENAGINSSTSDYGAFVYQGKLYFASARDTGGITRRRHKWNGESFTNFYSSDIDSVTNEHKKARRLSSVANSKFHESSIVFTKDGKTVYFTRNNYHAGKRGYDEKRTTLLKIYVANFDNGKMSNVQELPFNSDNYSVAHPALSPDDKTLYFASDMPGSYGQSDLYKVSIGDGGRYGTPENLGSKINTEGKETFPYVTRDNEIYFASDGHPGLGALDIFGAKIGKDGDITGIQNLGSGINSPKDDFGYFIDPVTQKGYFTSNKAGGKGSDDIYKFREKVKLKLEEVKPVVKKDLVGSITDANTGALLSNVVVKVYDENGVLKDSTFTDENGKYSFNLETGKNYNVRLINPPNYLTKEMSVTLHEGQDNVLSAEMDRGVCKITVGDDLGKCFDINNIYFPFNKSNITEEAIFDLEKILEAMTSLPTLKIDIRSHTDSRGSNEYNKALSERRAKATMSWLVRNGIAKDRLSSKGYGETSLVADCPDGVECSSEDHQKNRRSEFIIKDL